MICCRSYLLSTIELGLVGRRGHRCQIPLSHIHPNDLLARLRRWLRCLDHNGHEKIEPFLGAVIPQFGRPNGGEVVQQGHMLAVAGVGDDDPPTEREDAYLLVTFERKISVVIVGQRWRDVVGRLIQALVALLGEASPSRLRVLLHLGPQRLVGGAYLPGDIAGHLRRQAEPGPHLCIRLPLEPLLVGGFAMGERVGTDEVQGITVRQLGGPEDLELLGRGGEFEFGGERGPHGTSVLRSAERCQASGRGDSSRVPSKGMGLLPIR